MDLRDQAAEKPRRVDRCEVTPMFVGQARREPIKKLSMDFAQLFDNEDLSDVTLHISTTADHQDASGEASVGVKRRRSQEDGEQQKYARSLKLHRLLLYQVGILYLICDHPYLGRVSHA